MPQDIRYALGECSLGTLLVAASDRGICFIALGEESDALVQDLEREFPRASIHGPEDSLKDQLAAVAALTEAPGSPATLQLDPGGTPFQNRVWDALQAIPAGETATYTQLAARIGSPRAVRAVGSACGANRLAVAIPCHRAVRSDGSLAGFRWGIDRKRELLRREAPMGLLE